MMARTKGNIWEAFEFSHGRKMHVQTRKQHLARTNAVLTQQRDRNNTEVGQSYSQINVAQLWRIPLKRLREPDNVSSI
ncbi:hypothetical protein BaRGS_00010445 [Batillaria attramentaria]|uniref:Uncharacterized protein n=1 Tax=Batillaria attramentaria TaxID=370345 RepID=A0ABD0LFH5_9CAEN